MKALFLTCVGAACLFITVPVAAHHAFSSEFDVNKPVSLTGSVTKMEWTNPHAWLFMEVKDDDGNIQTWAVELVGINDLLRLGWGRSTVKAGDVLSVEGFGARNGTNTANAASVTVTKTGELLWESVSRAGRQGRERNRSQQ